MNKIAVGVIALIIILGIVAGVTFFNHSGSSKPSISIPTNVSQLVSTTTITATTNNQNQHQIISGKILYEIIAPADSRTCLDYFGNKNYTIVWVVFNITNPTSHEFGILSSHLNGYRNMGAYYDDEYPINGPKYGPIHMIYPNSSNIGWIQYEVPNMQDAIIKNVTLHIADVDTGDQYNVILYPTSNYTVLYADNIFIRNISSDVYPLQNPVFVIPGKTASIPFGISLSYGYNYATILGFSSPIIKIESQSISVYSMNNYVNITVTKFVPYVIYTYFYAKGENKPPQQ